jgi:hypothetical protein
LTSRIVGHARGKRHHHLTTFLSHTTLGGQPPPATRAGPYTHRRSFGGGEGGGTQGRTTARHWAQQTVISCGVSVGVLWARGSRRTRHAPAAYSCSVMSTLPMPKGGLGASVSTKTSKVRDTGPVGRASNANFNTLSEPGGHTGALPPLGTACAHQHTNAAPARGTRLVPRGSMGHDRRPAEAEHAVVTGRRCEATRMSPDTARGQWV